MSACTPVALLGDLERPLHEARVRVAHELVGAFLQGDGERLRPGLPHARLDVDPRAREVEVVLVRLVRDDELDLPRLRRLLRQLDGESGADGALVGLRRGRCRNGKRERARAGYDENGCE